MPMNNTFIFIKQNKTIVILSSLFLLWTCHLIFLEFRLEQIKKEIHNEGYPVTLEELDKWYPEVPESENAAKFYEEAYRKYKDIDYSDKKSETLLCSGIAHLPALGEAIPEEVLKTSSDFCETNKESIGLYKKASELEKCRFSVNLRNGVDIDFSYLDPFRPA